ncbi:MAG TPA: hypothetical protein VFP19_08690 [Candidatus Limnocylindrales bacterium]|nr:hypothetical protein [Candidatus Limnocylindrales bacterium]
MLPLLLVSGGLVALAAGFGLLRSLGPGYRVGRLLVTTPLVPISEAVRLASSGERAYVAIEGRIDSDDEFEDAAHNPLVLRRTRIAARTGLRWRRFEDGLEVVPFEIRDAVAGVAVDTAALGDGLVVMPRISRGVVSDLGDRAPSTVPRDAAALVTIDQVSSVEHARVLGWPAVRDDGRTLMTAGSGRPLILSTLETGEAMRVLAGGERVRPRLAAVAFALAAGLLALGLVVGGLTAVGAVGVLDVPVALAAGPSPVPTSMAGDTRSSGEGPGLVGNPGVAILGVLGLGLVAVGATLLYVRATGGRRPS